MTTDHIEIEERISDLINDPAISGKVKVEVMKRLDRTDTEPYKVKIGNRSGNVKKNTFKTATETETYLIAQLNVEKLILEQPAP